MELLEKIDELVARKGDHASAEGEGNGKGTPAAGVSLTYADRAVQTFGEKVVKRLWQEFYLDEKEMAIMAALFNIGIRL